MASPINMFMLFMLLAWLANSGESATGNKNNYVQDACSVTTYKDLCVHTLEPFSNTARRSPGKWARAGVSVTIGEVKNVSQVLFKLKRNNRIMRGRNRLALFDCIECFENTIDELHQSLGILRKLSARDFDTQMADLTTFVSAALTDEDTCLDGFEGQNTRQVNLLKIRVLKTTYLTSNALALVNKLATTGFESLSDP